MSYNAIYVGGAQILHSANRSLLYSIVSDEGNCFLYSDILHHSILLSSLKNLLDRIKVCPIRLSKFSEFYLEVLFCCCNVLFLDDLLKDQACADALVSLIFHILEHLLSAAAHVSEILIDVQSLRLQSLRELINDLLLLGLEGSQSRNQQ